MARSNQPSPPRRRNESGHDGVLFLDSPWRTDARSGPGWSAGPYTAWVSAAVVMPWPLGVNFSRPGVTRPLVLFVDRTIWMWESLVQSAGFGSRRTLVRIQPSRLRRESAPLDACWRGTQTGKAARSRAW